jgi:glycosyltransferase involved in cell wall biosynthesis
LLCVPVYNEEYRLGKLLQELQQHALQCDVLFLNDGSTDGTETLLVGASLQNRNVRIQNFSSNRGKGAVLRDGFLRAAKEGYQNVGFCDADGSVSLADVDDMRKFLEDHIDVSAVIGRRQRQSVANFFETQLRRILSQGFHCCARFLFGLPYHDVQAGVKFFRTSSLPDFLQSGSGGDRWLFDLQLLLGLHRNHCRIEEFQIKWQHQAHSKLRLLSDLIKIVKDLLLLKIHDASRGYALQKKS